jgi:Mrp family chromosome partitioning ATPase/capsular polysaccharide biosynthesis protein
VLNGRSLPAALWRRRGTAALVVVLVAAATVAWLVLAPRRYTATASVAATPLPTVTADHGTVQDLQATIAAVADSPSVVSDLATRLGYHGSLATLRNDIWAERVPGTALIGVHVESATAAFAARAANQLAGMLGDYDPTGGQFRFSIVAPAAVPTCFSSPDLTATIVLAVLAGIVLAIAAALLRERLAGRVDDRGQLAVLARTPVLTRLPRPADPNEKSTDVQGGPGAAAFRELRVGLEYATSDEPTSLVVLTPAVRDDAAAWTAVNLAGALAVVEHRVLVIDADFAAVQPHPAFKSKGPGLADVLRGDVELRDAVRPTQVSGVSVLPAGNLAGASAATLLELHFHQAMAQIHKQVDVILVHCAPVAESDDALVMAAGNALLVSVPAGRVRPRAVSDLAGRIHRTRVRLVGAVLLGGRTRRAK